jgi:hypothetical protein
MRPAPDENSASEASGGPLTRGVGSRRRPQLTHQRLSNRLMPATGGTVNFPIFATVQRCWPVNQITAAPFAASPSRGYRVANIHGWGGKVLPYTSSTAMRMRTSFDEWLWSKVLQRQASPFWRRVGRWLNRPYANAFPVTSPRR